MSQPNKEANIILALQAYQNNPELGLHRAAEIYQASYGSLCRRTHGISSRYDITPKSRKLSDLEEQAIIRFILDLDSRGFPPQLRGIEEIERLIRYSIAYVSKTEFFLAFYAAFQATITEVNIKAGFRGAGLVPLDPESVVSKLDVQARTPMPFEEEASHPNPWVSKTPKTVLEAESQSKYLERRIRRHQSSSPESILDSLKSL
ncbi:uncharacterized protein FPRO_16008 [Fusarium proliferatum ET1]|uniref:HTH psq-type domain-containing protein n=1 Tax=Fusarium proliferatum (strain ET1) TaxID=1227346 RepID=A0A1L7WB23_FUSPR|nr:uncharacterized protein FPRO_16008 [Fusarium proliferatum ET1]CZR49800.1 uncharacterized protein FPRO_16008 [Fusarium proliferatum ET1]